MEEQVMETKKRPTFITVLGILGFIGVAWQVIAGIIQMLAGMAYSAVSNGVSAVAESAGQLSDIPGGDQAMNELGSQLESANAVLANGTMLGIVSIVAALICLLGIIWMWGLKKKGYYVYIIGEIAPVVATVAVAGFSLTGGMMAVLGMIFPIIFIVLWGLNLKHMN